MPNHKLRPGELTDEEITIAWAQENNFMRAIATAAHEKAMRRAAEIARGVYGGRHQKWASENADIYNAQDDAVERCATAIEREAK